VSFWRGSREGERIGKANLLYVVTLIYIPLRGIGQEIFTKYFLDPPRGFVVDLRLATALIRTFSSPKEAETVYSIYEWISRCPQLAFDPYVVAALLCFCSKTKNVSFGERIMLDIERSTLFDVHSRYEEQDELEGSRNGKSSGENGPVQLQYLISAAAKMYSICGRPNNAIQILEVLKRKNVPMNEECYETAFQICTRHNLPEFGKRVYAEFLESSYRNSTKRRLNTAILLMLEKLEGSKATETYFGASSAKLNHLTLENGTLAISLAIRSGDIRKASELFDELISRKISFDDKFFVSLFRACASAKSGSFGKKVHRVLLRAPSHKLKSEALRNSLLGMYARCEGSQTAIEILKSFKRSAVTIGASTWNVLFQACQEENDAKRAMALFENMEVDCVRPDLETYLILSSLIADTLAGEYLAKVDEKARSQFPEPPGELALALLKMHARCKGPEAAFEILSKWKEKASGLEPWHVILDSCAETLNPSFARKTFKEIQVNKLALNVHSWNKLIAAHRVDGMPQVLGIFETMLKKGVVPDKTTFEALLSVDPTTCNAAELQKVTTVMAKRNITDNHLLERLKIFQSAPNFERE
jgi:pentatricopeptide repeat protein